MIERESARARERERIERKREKMHTQSRTDLGKAHYSVKRDLIWTQKKPTFEKEAQSRRTKTITHKNPY